MSLKRSTVDSEVELSWLGSNSLFERAVVDGDVPWITATRLALCFADVERISRTVLTILF